MTLSEMLKKQVAISDLIVKGTATAEQKTEFEALTKSIGQVMALVEAAKPNMQLMKLADFQAWAKDAMSRPDMLDVLVKNLAAVKAQGKTNADDQVLVEMPVSPAPAAPVAPAVPVVKQDSPIKMIASDILDKMLAKLADVKAKVLAGTLTKDDLNDGFILDWNARQLLDSCLALLKKVDATAAALKDLSTVVKNDEPAAPPANATSTPAPAAPATPPTAAPASTPAQAPAAVAPTQAPVAEPAPAADSLTKGVDLSPERKQDKELFGQMRLASKSKR
jgi:hypothetical protein